MEQLNQRLVQVVKDLFPDAPIRSAQFWPLVDLSYADLTSEIAFELAECLHKPPSSIAREIIRELGSEWGEFFEERGYVNLRMSNAALINKTPSGPYHDTGVIVAPAYIIGDQSEFFRMSALAIMQANLADALDLKYEFKSIDGAKPHLSDFLEPSLVSQQTFTEWVTSQVHEQKIYCWVTPSLLDVPNFLAWSKPFYPHRLQILSAPYEWANNAAWVEWQSVLERVLPTHEATLHLLLASAPVAQDLDLECSHLQERRNLWWFLTSTLERIERMQLTSEEFEVQDCELTPHFKYLLLRSKFLNDYQFLAASKGKVRDLFIVLEEYLTQINWLLNQPELRIRAHEKRLKSFEQYIFTSVQRALSDIVVTLRRGLHCKGVTHGEYAG